MYFIIFLFGGYPTTRKWLHFLVLTLNNSRGQIMEINGIEKSRLFLGMTAKELSTCLDLLESKEKNYRKDDIILHAGDKTSAIGMVLSGSVTIESNDVWGNCTVLSHVGKGQYFAETYALLGEVLLGDVRANEDCNILFCNIRNLLDDSNYSRCGI